MSVVKFGTIEFLKDTWKKLFLRRKKGDSLTRHQMREVAQKIVVKQQKEQPKEKKSKES